MAFLAIGFVAGALVIGFGDSTGSADVSDRPVEILATVGGSDLSRAAVERAQGGNFAQIRRQMYDMTSQALERAIQTKLVELEAQAQGIGVDSLISKEVDAKIQEPSEQAIADLYEERGLQGQGSVEELAPQIRDYLRDQSRSARFQTLVAELEEKYGTQRYLEPLRMTVATEGFPSRGPEGAPVTIVEFSDFQCPYCRLLQDPLTQLEAEYGEQVRFVFRQFPLTAIHPEAAKAGEAALCAHDQGLFWEMNEAMFANQQALGMDQLKETAASLGMGTSAFNACLDESRYAEEVASDLAAGQSLGIRGTPNLFVNGRPLTGLKTFEQIAEIVDDELNRIGR